MNSRPFSAQGGIAYSRAGERNITALTPAGTLKQTLCVPATMAAGPRAFAAKAACVIVDFEGLKGFSGREVVANLGGRWPGLVTQRLAFPDMPRGEVYPEVMARALEVPATRQKLAAALQGVAGPAPGDRPAGDPRRAPAGSGACGPAEAHRTRRSSRSRRCRRRCRGSGCASCSNRPCRRKGVTLIPQHKVTRLSFDREVRRWSCTTASARSGCGRGRSFSPPAAS